MISEFFVMLGLTIAEWFVGLFPEWDLPSELSIFDDTLNTFVAPFANMSAWVPWAVLILCATVAVTVWASTWLVKAIAWLWGQVPVIGGSG